MSMFFIIALVVTAGYVIYFITMVLLDLKAMEKNGQNSNSEQIDVDGFDEIKPVSIEEKPIQVEEPKAEYQEHVTSDGVHIYDPVPTNGGEIQPQTSGQLNEIHNDDTETMELSFNCGASFMDFKTEMERNYKDKTRTRRFPQTDIPADKL